MVTDFISFLTGVGTLTDSQRESGQTRSETDDQPPNQPSLTAERLLSEALGAPPSARDEQPKVSQQAQPTRQGSDTQNRPPQQRLSDQGGEPRPQPARTTQDGGQRLEHRRQPADRIPQEAHQAQPQPGIDLAREKDGAAVRESLTKPSETVKPAEGTAPSMAATYSNAITTWNKASEAYAKAGKLSPSVEDGFKSAIRDLSKVDTTEIRTNWSKSVAADQASYKQAQKTFDKESQTENGRKLLEAVAKAETSGSSEDRRKVYEQLRKESPQLYGAIIQGREAESKLKTHENTLEEIKRLEDTPSLSRQFLATCLLRENRKDEARQYLQEVVNKAKTPVSSAEFKMLAQYAGMMLDPNTLDTQFDKVAGRVDQNNDQALSKKELGAAVGNPAFVGTEAHTVAALYAAFDSLSQKTDKEPTITSESIKKTMGTKEALLMRADAADTLRTMISKNNTALDTDKDGKYSGAELGALAKILDEFSNATADGKSLTPAEFADVLKKVETKNLKTLDTLNKVEDVSAGVLYANRTSIPRTAFGAATPIDSITPEAVLQGMSKDCVFDAIMASDAAHHPGFLAGMIKENADESFVVSLPGADKPIDVPKLTEAEKGLFNQPSKYGVWPGVLEKAAGQYMLEHGLAKAATPQEALQVDKNRGVQLLTGELPTYSALIGSPSQAEVSSILKSAIDAGQPVAAGSGLLTSLFRSSTKDGFESAHAYSVTHFDPAGPDGGTVSMRNPWGTDRLTESPNSVISVKQFQANFGFIITGNKKATPK